MQTVMTQRQRGFTLIEAVMVIAITGIVAAMVAIFIRTPIQGYFDLERRVEMTDTADTACAASRATCAWHCRTACAQWPLRRCAWNTCRRRAGGRYRADIGALGPRMFWIFHRGRMPV